jgi:hypothetical protein
MDVVDAGLSRRLLLTDLGDTTASAFAKCEQVFVHLILERRVQTVRAPL